MTTSTWLPPLAADAEQGREIWKYPDGSSVHAESVEINSMGDRATLYRAATGDMGRGWVPIHKVPIHLRSRLYGVPNNSWQDAYFRSPEDAAAMLHSIGKGPANVRF